MRKQACQILGISENATEEEIKAAYKSLVKYYHPDTGNVKSPEYYHNIVRAYQYLKMNPIQTGQKTSGARVIGGKAAKSKYAYSYSREKEYAQFEKGYQKKREERRAELAQRAREEQVKQEKYDKAMEAINAIRIAEAIKALIRESEE